MPKDDFPNENGMTKFGFERVLRAMLNAPPMFTCAECGEEVEPAEILRRMRVFCYEHAPKHGPDYKSQPFPALEEGLFGNRN